MRAAALAELTARVADLTERFTAAGHEVHVVGGPVRDALLDMPIGDLDLATDARPDDIKRLLGGWADAIWTQGERFGTIGCRRGDDAYEITTYRAEVYDAASRKPHVVFGDDLRTDLSRRDFTINAMAVDPVTAALIDPFDGQAALGDRVLATPLAPEVAFTDDPLRMLRAARFIARFELTATEPLVDAARDLADRLAIVSAERIGDELAKLLAVGDPRPGLSFLGRTGLLAHIAAELTVPEPIHAVAADPVDRLAALLGDAGPDGAARALDRLRASAAQRDRIVDLVGAVAAVDSEPWSAARTRRWAASTTDPRRAATLAAALDRPGAAALADALDALASAGEEPGAVEEVPLDGDDVMVIAGLEPGPAVGRLLARLREHRLEHGPLDRATAERLVTRWSRQA